MTQASAEKLEHTFQKEKEQTRLSRAPDYEGEESQNGRESHLGEREENQSESMRRKRWTPR